MAEDDPRSEEIKAKRIDLKLEKNPLASSAESRPEPEIKQEGEDPISSPDPSKKPPKSRSKKKDPDPAIKIEDGSPTPAPAKATLSTKPIQMHRVMVEGYGLRYCMNTDGVDPYHTQTNSVMETLAVLGVEAARAKIITEIQEVTKDLSIDPRHMALLADVMTYKGEVLGITRFGLAKMRDSVLQLASFEKTADHVFDAGWAGKTDKIEGVSECVIVGKTMGVGTGSVEVVRTMGIQTKDLERQPTYFEDGWNEE